jgi:hypothetical protein
MQEAAQREHTRAAATQQAEASRLYTAARTIQDAWRSHKNRRIYRFFRDLIRFRSAACWVSWRARQHGCCTLGQHTACVRVLLQRV